MAPTETEGELLFVAESFNILSTVVTPSASLTDTNGQLEDSTTEETATTTPEVTSTQMPTPTPEGRTMPSSVTVVGKTLSQGLVIQQMDPWKFLAKSM